CRTLITSSFPSLFSLSPFSFFLFFFHCAAPHPLLHSFPTRRSSDLAVDFRRRPARVHQRLRVAAEPLTGVGDLFGCPPRRVPLTPGGEEADLAVDLLDALFHRAAHGRGDAARMPVETQNAAERLKPERIGQTAKNRLTAELA